MQVRIYVCYLLRLIFCRRIALYSHQLVNEADAELRSLGIDMDLIPLPLSLYVRCHKVFYLVLFPVLFHVLLMFIIFSTFSHNFFLPKEADDPILQVFANRVIGQAAWESKEYGKGLGYLTRAGKLLDSCANDVLEAAGDHFCKTLGSKVSSFGAEVLSKRDAYQKENDSIYHERVLHTDENLPLAEPFVAVQAKVFDLLLPIETGLLLAFK